MTGAGELPQGFSFEDFLGALDEIDAPVDEDLPTDADGCVELVTLGLGDLAGSSARLRAAGIEPHVEMPGQDEVPAVAMASVFVPATQLRRARRVLGIEA